MKINSITNNIFYKKSLNKNQTIKNKSNRLC